MKTGWEEEAVQRVRRWEVGTTGQERTRTGGQLPGREGIWMGVPRETQALKLGRT